MGVFLSQDTEGPYTQVNIAVTVTVTMPRVWGKGCGERIRDTTLLRQWLENSIGLSGKSRK